MYVEVCIDTHGVIHVPTHIVHDEVWVVTWGNSHGGVALLGQADAYSARVDGCVINGYLTVSGLLRKFSIHEREIVSKSILFGERKRGL